MSWVNLPADRNTQWWKLNFINQFVDAISERFAAKVNQYTDNYYIPEYPDFVNPLKTEGANAQTTSLWGNTPPSGFQYLIASFLLDHSVGRPYLKSSPASPDDYYEFSDLLTDAIGQGHFTRKYRDDSGEIVITTGFMQVGDFIGPWIFNELQAVLQQLHVVRATNDEIARFALKHKGWPSKAGEGHTLSEAKSSALSGWAQSELPQYYDWEEVDTVIGGASLAVWSYIFHDPSADEDRKYGAELSRYNSVIGTSPAPWLQAGNSLGLGVWIRPTNIVYGDFNSQGHTISQDVWKQIQSSTLAVGETHINGLYPELSTSPPPNWPIPPSGFDSELSSAYVGWQASNDTDDRVAVVLDYEFNHA